MTPEHDVVQFRISALRWALAQWLLATWNPDLMDFLRDAKKRRRSRLRSRPRAASAASAAPKERARPTR